MRQSSAPPLLTLRNTCLYFQDDSINSQNSETIHEKRTIEFGPWNQQDEQMNQYLDDEFSLSKYNHGFSIKNENQQKKKQTKRQKKRNFSQKNQRYDSKTSPQKQIQLQIKDDQQMILRGVQKNKENLNDNQYLNVEKNIINQNDSNNIIINTNQQNDVQQVSVQAIFLGPLKMNKQINENSRVKKPHPNYCHDTQPLSNKIKLEQIQQFDISCDTEPISNKIKTEPTSYSSSTPPYSTMDTNIFQNKEHFKKNKTILPKNQRLYGKLQNVLNNACNKSYEIIQRNNNKKQKEEFENSDDYNDTKIKNQSLDNISTQSHSVEEYSSSSSISLKENSKNLINTCSADTSQRRRMEEYNLSRTYRKQVNYSLDLNPNQSSPIKMKNLFQISSTNNSQIDDQLINYGRRLKTEEMYEKKSNLSKTNNQQFLKQHNNHDSQQYQNIFKYHQNIENSQLKSSLSPQNFTDYCIVEKNLQLSQNHLRLSHYQISQFNKNQYSTQPNSIKNERNILNEIRIPSSSNSYNFRQDTNKSQEKNTDFQFESQNKNQRESENKTSTIQQRKNILKSCLEDCKRYYETKQRQNIISQDQKRQMHKTYINQRTQYQNIDHSENFQYKNNFNEESINTNNLNLQNQRNKNSQELIQTKVTQNNIFSPNPQQGFNSKMHPLISESQNKRTQDMNQPINQIKVPHNITFGKMKIQQNQTQNDQFWRRSCSPQQNFIQKQNNEFSKSIIIEQNDVNSKNKMETYQPLQIIKNESNNKKLNLPIIKMDSQPMNIQ